MKNIVLIALACLLTAAGASAETRIRLSAKTASTSRDTKDYFKTDYGSYDRDVFQVKVVTVNVQCTLGTENGKILVQWVGRNKAKNSAAELLSSETKDIQLQPGMNFSRDFAECFAESDAKYKALGERLRDGYRFGGWIVRILDANGKVLAEQSSSTPLLKKFPVDAKAQETRQTKD